MKANMSYEELRNSMTVQDAARVLRDTNCYGTMDIAKNVILRALEQEPCEKCCNGNQEEKAKLCQKSYIVGMEHPRWIPLTKRPMTKEEREEYEGIIILNCPLPEDGQEVLVSYGGYVCVDTFHNDDGCYFEDVEIDDVEAWMPLPLPYKAESEE